MPPATKTPKLTVGMAVYDDYDGAFFTLQSLRLHHDLSQVELLVIDNAPQTAAGQMLRGFVENFAQQRTAGARYVALPDPVGTTVPRDRVFYDARGDAVLCLDSHVLLELGAISKLIAWYDAHPDSRDLLTGPLLYDDLKTVSTHFDDLWRDEMWGVWASAWQCACASNGKAKIQNPNSNPLTFSVQPDLGRGPAPGANSPYAKFRALVPGEVPVTRCGRCGAELPEIAFFAHEDRLRSLGFRPLGAGAHLPGDEAAFEIPGQGLGLFTCRREAWLGFNPHFRGFGGEEMYIHTKYRQAGRKNLCLPFLRWNHRFGRPGGVKFPLTRWNKVRNYVLGHQELGLSLDPVKKHFVGEGKLTEEQWQYLLDDPVHHLESNACEPCNAMPNRAQPDAAAIEAAVAGDAAPLLQWCAGIERDLEKHLPKLAELASQCSHVTEFSGRRESTVGLLCGLLLGSREEAPSLISHNTERDRIFQTLSEKFPALLKLKQTDSPAIERIEPTDLLFLDTQHSAARLGEELAKFAGAVRRYIVVHDTATYGETGEDGGPGLLAALRVFMKQQPQWSVLYHTAEQYGLTVIGCLAEDKPKLPGKITMAANFARAVKDHVLDGAEKAAPEVLEERLLVCTLCEHRSDDRCSVCGCGLSIKASWRSSECPLGKWQDGARDAQAETQPNGEEDPSLAPSP